jgi:hypothetical protein
MRPPIYEGVAESRERRHAETDVRRQSAVDRCFRQDESARRSIVEKLRRKRYCFFNFVDAIAGQKIGDMWVSHSVTVVDVLRIGIWNVRHVAI